jgi:hypothetical protein
MPPTGSPAGRSCCSAASSTPHQRGDDRDDHGPTVADRLPAYAHELNPVEPVWSHLKRSLANLTRHTIAELTALAKIRLRRMQYRPALLAGFLASAGLDLGPSCNPRP